MIQLKDSYNIDGICELLNISPDTVWRLQKKNVLKCKALKGNRGEKDISVEEVKKVTEACSFMPKCKAHTCQMCVFGKCIALSECMYIDGHCKFYKENA